MAGRRASGPRRGGRAAGRPGARAGRGDQEHERRRPARATAIPACCRSGACWSSTRPGWSRPGSSRSCIDAAERARRQAGARRRSPAAARARSRRRVPRARQPRPRGRADREPPPSRPVGARRAGRAPRRTRRAGDRRATRRTTASTSRARRSDPRARLVADWWAAGDLSRSVMLAQRRDDVRDLNARAREHMRAAGRLGDQELRLPGGELRGRRPRARQTQRPPRSASSTATAARSPPSTPTHGSSRSTSAANRSRSAPAISRTAPSTATRRCSTATR